MKQNTTSIFLFHRDLRLDDNTGLREAMTHSHTVIPLFICDTRQLHHNAYASTHAIQFMAESLLDLEKQLNIHHKGRLYYAEGISHDVIDTICKQIRIDAVYSNYDYTPFARQRDEHITKTLQTHHIPFFQYHDALLTIPDNIQTGQQTPYTVFTPFYKKASTVPVQKPILYHHTEEWYTKPIEHTTHTLPIPHVTSSPIYPGGRHAGLQLLKQLHLHNQIYYKSIQSQLSILIAIIQELLLRASLVVHPICSLILHIGMTAQIPYLMD